MSPGERFFIMHDELSEAFKDLGERGRKDAEYYSREASKEKFSELPKGQQRHALRGMSAAYRMQQNYSENWMPSRGATYDKYPKNERIYIGDFVFVHPHGQLTESKTVGDVFGPQGTYGRVIGIKVVGFDPVDNYANVQLGNGQRGAFAMGALEKVDRRRLTHAEWQRLLSSMWMGEVQDIARDKYGGRGTGISP